MQYIVGIDIGGTKISVVLATSKGAILEKLKLKTLLHSRAKDSIQEILQAVDTIIKRRNLPKKRIRGIGIGIPGLLGKKPGIITNSPNLPGWEGINIKKILKKRFGVKVECNNDANAACVAEKLFGKGKNVDNFIYITVSTGIGAGIILNNTLVLGGGNNTGEIGHMPVELCGSRCSCGKTGCLEMFSSGTAIQTITRNVLMCPKTASAYCKEQGYRKYSRLHKTFSLKKAAKKSILNKYIRNRQHVVDAQLVAEAAQKRDALARYIYWRAGYYFGMGLAQIIHTLNPDMIALGGSIVKAGTIFLTPMQQAVREHTWPELLDVCVITKARLGQNVADIGAISLMLQNKL